MVGSRVYVGGLPYGCRERDLERFFKGYGRTRDILLKNGYGFIEFDDYRDADDAVYELNGKELLGERIIVEHARGNARRGGGGGGGGGDRYGGDRYGGGGRPPRRTGGFYKVSVERARGTPRGSDVWRGRVHQPPPPPRNRRPRNREPDYRNDSRYGPPTRTDYRLIVENLSSRVSWQDLKDYMRQAGEVTYADAHKDRRNEGVVEFASSSDLKNALEKLDDTDLNGRRIRLVEDRRRSRRSRSSSSRSRSRSRSRRRSRSSRRSSRSRSRRSSRSKSRAKSGSRSKSRSKSADRKSKSRSRSKSASKKESKSRSRSVDKRDRSLSRSKSGNDKSRSRSRSIDRRSRSNDRNGNDTDRSGSKGKSKSRSRSVEQNGDQSPDNKN